MRRFLVVPALVAIALLAAACGDDGDDGGAAGGGGEAGEVRTVAAGKLTACTDVPYAPFEYEEGGQVVGVDADLVREMAKRLDLTAEFRRTPFDGIFAALAAGQCDIIASSVSITEERKRQNDFTDGYFEINQSLLVRKDDASRYENLEALRGKTVGVQSGTTGADFAKEKGGPVEVQVKEFGAADDLFTALKAGQIEAVLQDYPVNAYNAKTTGETVVSATFTDAEKESYGFVVRKNNPGLRDALNRALREMREDGTYDTVLAKYLGKPGTL